MLKAAPKPEGGGGSTLRMICLIGYQALAPSHALLSIMHTALLTQADAVTDSLAQGRRLAHIPPAAHCLPSSTPAWAPCDKQMDQCIGLTGKQACKIDLGSIDGVVETR